MFVYFPMNVTQIQIYLIYDMAKHLLQILKLFATLLEFRDFTALCNAFSIFHGAHDIVDSFALIFQFCFHLRHAITSEQMAFVVGNMGKELSGFRQSFW